MQRVIIEPIFRVIKEHPVKAQGQPLEALRISFKQLREAAVDHGLTMVFECQPGGRFGQCSHVGSFQ